MNQFQLNTRSDFASDKPNLLKLLKTLKELREIIKVDKTKHFDLAGFYLSDIHDGVCRTVACAFGWFVVMNPDCGYKIHPHNCGWIVPNYVSDDANIRGASFNEWEFVEELFSEECDCDPVFLFHQPTYFRYQQAPNLDNVINRVEHLLRGGNKNNYDYGFGKRYPDITEKLSEPVPAKHS